MVLRLLEQQLQAWRLSVQSEQSILEKRCSGVEGTLEVLRRETGWLEGLLTQVIFDLLHHVPLLIQGLGGPRHHWSRSSVCHSFSRL